MPLYAYECFECEHAFEEMYPVKLRDVPTTYPCPRCGEYSIERGVGCAGFTVPEGGAGNAANGYSSTHGDAENFKARDKGEPPAYDPKECKISESMKG